MRGLRGRHTRMWSACVVLILVGIEAVLGAQPPLACLGFVVDATGLPLPGATITLRGEREQITVTDAAGLFTFTSLADKDYEVTATLPGFAETRQRVRLTSVRPTVVTLSLTPLLLEQVVVTARKQGRRTYRRRQWRSRC